ncbi:MAG: AbrB/MazE/SpoVT family DNA-binding domain-containing protein [Spirochaetaceae bacterium]
MKVTIDKAGRIVIPKHVRDRYHLQPGTELEIENEPNGISLRVQDTKPSLIRKRGILVHHGSDTVTLDTASFVNRQRQHRNYDVAGDIAAENPKE